MADLRPGKRSDVTALRAFGEAVVPATYDPIDAAYGQRMLDEVTVPNPPWPDDIWMRREP